MINNIKTLYGNGCSFTNDNHIKLDLDKPLYLELLGEMLGTEVINNAFPGSCNRRIIRTTIRDCILHNFDHKTFVLVQLTFLERTEKLFVPNKYNFWKASHNTAKLELHESIKPNDPGNTDYSDHFLKHFDAAAELVDLATDLVMLSGFLKHRNIPHYIFHYPVLTHQGIVNSVIKDPIITQLVQNTHVANIQGQALIEKIVNHTYCYDGSHMNPDGHKIAADILLKLINFSN
jgi:hypothetical protein